MGWRRPKPARSIVRRFTAGRAAIAAAYGADDHHEAVNAVARSGGVGSGDVPPQPDGGGGPGTDGGDPQPGANGRPLISGKPPLSIGVGHALAARIDKKDYHTYVMTGDGELGEGQIWEAAASAAKYRLGNLTCIVDRNHYQQTGAAEEVLDMDPIDGKFAAFGWKTSRIALESIACRKKMTL